MPGSVWFSTSRAMISYTALDETMVRGHFDNPADFRDSLHLENGSIPTRARCAAFPRVCVLTFFLMTICGAAVPQQDTPLATIAGRVLDRGGKPVPDILVLLTGPTSQRASSDSAGGFEFSALAAGHYRLAAKGSTADTASAWIDIAPGTLARVDLQLGKESAATVSSQPPAALAQAMQFADDPHFTIAGITDWTAAGGHGSDASLRTSEALTRETLNLQPDTEKSRPCPEGEGALRTAAASQPASFEANHCLGIFYLRSGKYADAAQSLDAAYRIRPSNAENEYALAEACEKAGDTARAREYFQRLSASGNTADLHRLAGMVDESVGDPVAAVHDFALAARNNPSEQNYFAWGSELLYHRAVLQARDVFEEGVRAWPRSARMLTALGTALFAGALYDDAAERLCQAAALEPDNPEPYLFLGRIEVAAPRPLPCVAQELAQFHQREPGNALADYYFAMALWKQQTSSADSSTQQIAALLHQATAADPGCGEAWLELGNLQAQSGDYSSAIQLYTRAIEAKPQLTEAYYRLGAAYDRTGQRDKARQAFAQHDQIEKEQAAEVEKQRREIKQFVVSSAESNPAGQHPKQ